MSALSGGLYRPGIILLLAISVGSRFTHSAPVHDENATQVGEYEGGEGGGVANGGCYYNFQHYREGDRIITNEPCLNCTCHNRMLMCYLRVCPFTKAIGQDCKVEKRADQCCPVITCPQVPVQLLTSTTNSPESMSSSTELGFRDNYGCSVDKKFYADGAQLPVDSHNPCELCYCIRNRTTCVMQECTLRVAGCQPVYLPGVCCPVKYNCDYEEEPGTAIETTPGLIMTTTIAPGIGAAPRCFHEGKMHEDGELIYSTEPCNHCYCFRGDIACAVQDCGAPMQSHGKNCTALPPPENECCPTTYECEDELGLVESQQTIVPDGKQSEITTKQSSETNDVVQATMATLPVDEESFPGADNSIPEITKNQQPEEVPGSQKESTKLDSETQAPSLNEGSNQKTDEASLTEIPITLSPEQSVEKTESGQVFVPIGMTVEDENRPTDAPITPEIPQEHETEVNEQATTVSDETLSISGATEPTNIVKDIVSETTEPKEEDEEFQITEKPIIEDKTAESSEATEKPTTAADEIIKPKVEEAAEEKNKEEAAKGVEETTDQVQQTTIIPAQVENATLSNEHVPGTLEEKAASLVPDEQTTTEEQTGIISTENSPVEESVTKSTEETSEFLGTFTPEELPTEESAEAQMESASSESPVEKPSSSPAEETQTFIPESVTKFIDEISSEEKLDAETESSFESSSEPSEDKETTAVTENAKVETPAISDRQPEVSTAPEEAQIPAEGPTGINIPERLPETKTEDDQAITTESEVHVTEGYTDAEHSEMHSSDNLVTETPYIAPTTYHPFVNITTEASQKIEEKEEEIADEEKQGEQQSTMPTISAEEAATLTSEITEEKEATGMPIDDKNSVVQEEQMATHAPVNEDEQQHVQQNSLVESEFSQEPQSTESSEIDTTTETSREVLSKDEGPTKGLTLESSSEETESSEESSAKPPNESSSEEDMETETAAPEKTVTVQSTTEAVSEVQDQSTESAGGPVDSEPKEHITETSVTIDENKTTESGSTERQNVKSESPEMTTEKSREESVTIEPQKIEIPGGSTESSTTTQEDGDYLITSEVPANSEELVTVKEDSTSAGEEGIPKPAEESVLVQDGSVSEGEGASTSVAPSDEKIEITSAAAEDISATEAPVVRDQMKPAAEKSGTGETASKPDESEIKTDENEPSEAFGPAKEPTEIPIQMEEQSFESTTTGSSEKSTEVNETFVLDGTTPATDVSQQTKEEAPTTEKSADKEAEPTEQAIQMESTEKSVDKETRPTEKSMDETQPTEESQTNEKSVEKEAEPTEQPVEIEAEPTEKTVEEEVQPTEKSTEEAQSTDKSKEETQPAETGEQVVEKEPETTDKSTEEAQPTEKLIEEALLTEKSTEEAQPTEKSTAEAQFTEKSPEQVAENTEKSIEAETGEKSLEKEGALPTEQVIEATQEPTLPTIVEQETLPTEITPKLGEGQEKPVEDKESTTIASEETATHKENIEKPSDKDNTDEEEGENTKRPVITTDAPKTPVKEEEETATESLPKISKNPFETSGDSDTQPLAFTTVESLVESTELPIENISGEKTFDGTETPTITEQPADLVTETSSVEDKEDISQATKNKVTEPPIVESEIASTDLLESGTDEPIVEEATTEKSVTSSDEPPSEVIPTEFSKKPESESPAILVVEQSTEVATERPDEVTEKSEISSTEKEATTVIVTTVDSATNAAVPEESSTVGEENSSEAEGEEKAADEKSSVTEMKEQSSEEQLNVQEAGQTLAEEKPSVTEAQETPTKEITGTLETKTPEAEQVTEISLEEENASESSVTAEEKTKTENPLDQVPALDDSEEISTQEPERSTQESTEKKTPESDQQENAKPFEEYGPPSGIPGEGNCLVDGQSYNNNTLIPPANPCQLSCRCVSSIVQCELVECPPPPNHLTNCMPVHNTAAGESCCPIYSCDTMPTVSLESENQMKPDTHRETAPESTDGPVPNNPELSATETKIPQEPVTETDESTKTEFPIDISTSEDIELSPVTDGTVKEDTVTFEESSLPTELTHAEDTDTTTVASTSEATPEEIEHVKTSSESPVFSEEQTNGEISTEQTSSVTEAADEVEKPAESTEQPSTSSVPDSEEEKPAIITEGEIKDNTEAAQEATSPVPTLFTDQDINSEKAKEVESPTTVTSATVETEVDPQKSVSQDSELPASAADDTNETKETVAPSLPSEFPEIATSAPSESVQDEQGTIRTPVTGETEPVDAATESFKPNETPETTIASITGQEEIGGSNEQSSPAAPPDDSTIVSTAPQQDVPSNVPVVIKIAEGSEPVETETETKEAGLSTASPTEEITPIPSETLQPSDVNADTTAVPAKTEDETAKPANEPTEEQKEEETTTIAAAATTTVTTSTEYQVPTVGNEEEQVPTVSKEEGQLSTEDKEEGQLSTEDKEEGQLSTEDKEEGQLSTEDKEEGQYPDVEKDKEHVSAVENKEEKTTVTPTTETSQDLPVGTDETTKPQEPSEEEEKEKEAEEEKEEEDVSKASEEKDVEMPTSQADETTVIAESEPSVVPTEQSIAEEEKATTVITKDEVSEEQTVTPVVPVEFFTQETVAEVEVPASTSQILLEEAPVETVTEKVISNKDTKPQPGDVTLNGVEKTVEETSRVPEQEKPTEGPVEIEQSPFSVSESSTLETEKEDEIVSPGEKPSGGLDELSSSTQQTEEIVPTQASQAETIADEKKDTTLLESFGEQESSPVSVEATTEQIIVKTPEKPLDLPEETASVVPTVAQEEQQHVDEEPDKVKEDEVSGDVTTEKAQISEGEASEEIKPSEDEGSAEVKPSDEKLAEEDKPSEGETPEEVEPSEDEMKPSEEAASTTTGSPKQEQTEKVENDLQHDVDDSQVTETPHVHQHHIDDEVQRPLIPEEHEVPEGQQPLKPDEEPSISTGPANDTNGEPVAPPTSDDLEYPENPVEAEENPHFPVNSGSYLNPDDDYDEDDQAVYGPGTCRYGGKVYVSAQQIPRDDPCDFCFCFRSDIICLQQSCPPPIPGCHEEPIRGFCCPRYECPVSMATSLNLTTTTTTTTTTLPPHFLSHAYKGAARQSGCQIRGQAYRVGQVIKSASGPCLHCTCGGDGNMKCDPRVCSPEPTLRQMIAAATARRRR